MPTPLYIVGRYDPADLQEMIENSEDIVDEFANPMLILMEFEEQTEFSDFDEFIENRRPR